MDKVYVVNVIVISPNLKKAPVSRAFTDRATAEQYLIFVKEWFERREKKCTASIKECPLDSMDWG